MRKKILIISVLILVAAGALWLSNAFPKTGKEKIVAVISFIDHPVLNEIQQSFERRLSGLCSEGNVEYRIISYTAQGNIEQLPAIISQVLSIDPEVIVTISTTVAQYVMREVDNEQKMVYSFVTNPADLGDELIRTNSTGVSDAVNYQENINLVRSIYGDSVRIGMLYNQSESNSTYGMERIRTIIKDLPIQLVAKAVNNDSNIPFLVEDLAKNVDCIYIGGDNTVVGAARAVVSIAKEKSIPVFASDEGSLYSSGAVGGISVNYSKLGNETAQMVYKILQGATPRDLPRQTIVGDKIIINQKEADYFHLNIPKEIIHNADTILNN